MTDDELSAVVDALKLQRTQALEDLVERTCAEGNAQAQVELALAMMREVEHLCVDHATDEVDPGRCPGYDLVVREAGRVLTRGRASKHPIWPYALGVVQLAFKRSPH